MNLDLESIYKYYIAYRFIIRDFKFNKEKKLERIEGVELSALSHERSLFKFRGLPGAWLLRGYQFRVYRR